MSQDADGPALLYPLGDATSGWFEACTNCIARPERHQARLEVEFDCLNPRGELQPAAMNPSPYDPLVLRERAELWRAEAAAATLEAMRNFCLTQADQCERRVELSLTTPVIREMHDIRDR